MLHDNKENFSLRGWVDSSLKDSAPRMIVHLILPDASKESPKTWIILCKEFHLRDYFLSVICQYDFEWTSRKHRQGVFSLG